VTNANELDVGYQWERSVFGTSSDQYKQRFLPVSRIEATKKAISEQWSRDWDPEKPKTTLGQEILACTKSYMSPMNAEKLRLYCAIGTALDRIHNIDGFFSLGEKILPIDLKAGTPPAGYIFSSFLLLMKDCNGIRLWRVCRKIAEALESNDKSSGCYSLPE